MSAKQLHGSKNISTSPRLIISRHLFSFILSFILAIFLWFIFLTVLPTVHFAILFDCTGGYEQGLVTPCVAFFAQYTASSVSVTHACNRLV